MQTYLLTAKLDHRSGTGKIASISFAPRTPPWTTVSKIWNTATPC